jgi:hypothetical protein
LVAGIFLARGPAVARGAETDARGNQFIAFKTFSDFARSSGERTGEVLLTSPEIPTRVSFNELIASWNVELPEATYLKVEARALYPAGGTRYYLLGQWSDHSARCARESVPNQKDAEAEVLTDTLVLREPAQRFQLRLTLGREDALKPMLKFIGVSLTDTRVSPPALPPNRLAWGRTLPVIERSQMAYPNGQGLCSPTTVSMIMNYWSQKLKRPELDKDVPVIADAVYDPKWSGAGNWPFNMAYAGSFPDMRGYVTRLSDLSELEDWIVAGVPVGLSVCYDRLRGKGPGPSGHLVVCVGFTQNGDVILNDGGTRQNVRKVFSRKQVASAWAYSHNAVYLIYPVGTEVPNDRFGHWESWTARLRSRQ